MVTSSATCVPMWNPFFARMRMMSETRNELTIATTSHHAFTRHQNQRTR